jgi:O-antigen/teichoic acid export membrane protein
MKARRLQRLPAAASPDEALRRLFGRGSIYTLVLAIQMLAAFLVVPVVTRLLAPSAYGLLATALVVYVLISILAAAGLPEAASRSFFAGADGPRRAQRLVVAIALIALAVALIVDLSGPLWAPLLSLRFGAVLRLAVWSGAAGAVMLGTQSLLRAAERPWQFAGVALIASLGGQAVAVLLTALLRTPTAYMAGIATGTTLGALIGVMITGAARAGLASRAELREALDLGLPIVPHSLAVSMLASADRVLIAAILGLAAAGRYQVAYAVGGVGVALVTAMNQAWIPLLLGTGPESRWRVLTITSRALHVCAGLVASWLALAAPLALLVAAPPSYGRHGLVAVAAIVSFSALPYTTSGTYFQVVFLTGRTRIMALAAPLAALVNIGLNLVLLRPWGLVGAALATVVAYAILPGIVAISARRMVSLPRATRDALTAWLLAAPFVLAGALLPPGWLGAGGRLAAALVAGACAAALLRRTASPRAREVAAGAREAACAGEAAGDGPLEAIPDGAAPNLGVRTSP